MARELLLLRHAKSDWSRDADDFDRPLNPRGKQDAARLARWAHEQGLRPDVILCSPARRAAQTAEALCELTGFPAANIRWDEDLYLAPVHVLLDALADLPAQARQVMVIGHNPGLEDLLLYLTPAAEAQRHKGKLLTTATLARMSLPDHAWTLQRGAATLMQFVRPRDLPE